MSRPLRLMKFLSIKDVINLLPISRPTFYKWLKEGKFENLVKLDEESGVYYIHPSNVNKLKEMFVR